jgi:hypothetical protein
MTLQAQDQSQDQDQLLSQLMMEKPQRSMTKNSTTICEES